MSAFYGGIDLHAKNAQVRAINEKGVAVKEKKFDNELAQTIGFFEPFGKNIQRFKSVRHFSSYCRLVPSIHQSGNSVKRGKGSKQGNPYLKCAFNQAAMFAARYDNDIRAYRDRRANKMTGAGNSALTEGCFMRTSIDFYFE